MDSENRLTVVLVGHPELRRRMGMAALDALAQRIVVRANVRGIARDEMGAYLAHRLRLAGSELPLFEPPTVEAIFQASSGLPRKAQQPRPPLALRSRHRQGQDRHHRARRRRTPRTRLNTSADLAEAGSPRSRAIARPLAFRHRGTRAIVGSQSERSWRWHHDRA